MDNTYFILKIVKEAVTSISPEAKIILFGSRSRKDFSDDSDFDLLILLNLETMNKEIGKRIIDALYDIEFEVGKIISPLIFTEKDWETKHRITPFYKNIKKDGKLL